MLEYIEQWLRKSLIKKNKTDQQKACNIVMPPLSQQKPIKDRRFDLPS